MSRTAHPPFQILAMGRISINSLIFRTQDTAKSFTTRKENVPANVSYAITHDFYRFYPPKGETSYRSYHMDPLQGSGMLRATMTNLLREKSLEMDGLSQHIKELQDELLEAERSRKSYEAEKKRSAGAIQKLRGQMAGINSQLSKIKAEDEDAVDDAENIKAKINTRYIQLDFFVILELQCHLVLVGILEE